LHFENRGIQDLSGVEFLKNLIFLYIGHNNISKLDLSENHDLRYLSCNHNNITSIILPISSELSEMDCSYNKIEKFDWSMKKIGYFFCSHNLLTELDLSKNDHLSELNCSNNKISKIKFSINSNFLYVNLSENELTKFPNFRNIHRLWGLNISNNKIDIDKIPIFDQLVRGMGDSLSPRHKFARGVSPLSVPGFIYQPQKTESK